MQRKATNIQVVGVACTGPGVYTMDELRLTITRLAKQLWPTIRTDEEAQYRIDEWLRRDKGLDSDSIRRLPAFTVMRWLENYGQQGTAGLREANRATRKGGRTPGKVKLSKHEKDSILEYKAGKKPSAIDEMMIQRKSAGRANGVVWARGTAELVIRAWKDREKRKESIS